MTEIQVDTGLTFISPSSFSRQGSYWPSKDLFSILDKLAVQHR